MNLIMKNDLFVLSLISLVLVYSCQNENELLDDELTSVKHGFILAGNTNLEDLNYHDIKDTTIQIMTGSHYKFEEFNLDVNNDGVNDFKLLVESTGGQSYNQRSSFIECFGSNNKIVMSVNHPAILEPDDTISDLSDFQYQERARLCYYFYAMGTDTADEYWNNQTNKYIGLQMIVDLDTLYGWVGLDVFDYSGMKVKDYAYRK